MGAIDVSKSSIARARRYTGSDDTWLILRTKSGSIESFRAVIDELNAEEEERDRITNDGVRAEFPGPVPSGYVVRMLRSTDTAEESWIAALARRLGAAGFEGKLGGAPNEVGPACLARSSRPLPVGHALWNVPDETTWAPASEWLVTPESTQRICEHVDAWTRQPDARMWLRMDMFNTTVALSDAAPLLQHALESSGYAGLTVSADPRRDATEVTFSPRNETLFWSTDDSQDWRRHVERITGALVDASSDITQAFIRPRHPGDSGFRNIERPLALPHDALNDSRYFHLWSRYLIDVHGVQIVRTAHLEKAHDLAGWDITDLGGDRHLVRAKDLARWYSEDLPHAQVVEQARSDFAGELLTKRIGEKNPPDWLRAPPRARSHFVQ